MPSSFAFAMVVGGIKRLTDNFYLSNQIFLASLFQTEGLPLNE